MRRTRRSKANSKRRGWMLVELLITLSIIAIVGSSVGYLISRMLRSSQAQADSLVRARTLHDWEDQFRQDSRAATAARIVPGNSPSIQFQQTDRRVTYLSSSDGLERRVNDQLAGRWPSRGAWEFSLQDNDKLVRAELASAAELSSSENLPQGQKELPRLRRLRVDAAIGRAP